MRYESELSNKKRFHPSILVIEYKSIHNTSIKNKTKRGIFSLLLCMAALHLCGCKQKADSTPAILSTTELEKELSTAKSTIEKFEKARTEVDKIKEEILSKIAASVSGIRMANEENPEGNPKKTIEMEGKMAADMLPEPSKNDIAKVEQRIRLGLEGKFSQLKDLYDKAYKDLSEERVLRARVEKEVEIARLEKDAAIIKARDEIKQIEIKSKTNEDGIRAAFKISEDAKDGEIRRLGQSRAAADWARNGTWLAGAALISAVYAFYCFYIRKDAPAGFAAASASGLSILGSIFCYMLSSFVGQPIFMNLSIGFGVFLTVLGVSLAAIFFIIHQRDKKKKEGEAKELEEKDMGNYVFNEIHDAFAKAKELHPEAAAIVGQVLKERLSEDSKIFIDKISISKKELKSLK